MLYTLPELPYAYDALEPHLDAQTMEIHHRKHHAAYVSNLNAAIEGQDFGSPTVEDLVGAIYTLPEEIR
ncbi:MAG TPA: superoxide dismutase, partial [Thermoguttaceae bacterium]|nr:superoxide dismutase [Thermoguttaceae bacterium]